MFQFSLLLGVHVEFNRKCDSSELHAARDGIVKLSIMSINGPYTMA